MTVARKQRRIIDGYPASSEFQNSLGGGGSVFVECGFCTRRHYAFGRGGSVDDGDGLVDDIINDAQKDPDGVFVYSDDCVHYKEINGLAIPTCCPCNGLRFYENFIWKHRSIFREYMKNMESKLEKELESVRGYQWHLT